MSLSSAPDTPSLTLEIPERSAERLAAQVVHLYKFRLGRHRLLFLKETLCESRAKIVRNPLMGR